MTRQKTVVSKIYDITPINIVHMGPLYDARWKNTPHPVIDGWQLGVYFKGNIESLVFDEILSKEYGLLPKHSKMIYRQYVSDRDITYVRYLFKHNLFVNGEKLAQQFKNKIQMQMANSGRDNNVLPSDAIVPFSVSKKPEKIKGGKGYKVSVRFDGDWELYWSEVVGRKPHGAYIDGYNYDFANHTTKVDYVFNSGVFGRGMHRAQKFIDNVNVQILSNQEKQYYTPIVIGHYEVYYRDDVFQKITLPVHFGDIYASVKVADACMSPDVQRKLGVKQLPRPDSDKVVLHGNASNSDYVVRYTFNNRSFQEAFFDMNRFRAKMLSAMQTPRNENIK